MYDPVRCHIGGIPLGQRQLMTYEVSGTGVFVEGDDLHFVNNAAMQQMWDDIRRTILVNMDLAHQAHGRDPPVTRGRLLREGLYR